MLNWKVLFPFQSVPLSERQSKFRLAMAKQSRLIRENINGEGLDIPLLGLRQVCKHLRPKQRIELFDDDDVYRKSNLFQLSTSQVPISLDYSYMGYGAVVPDGYGVSYNLQPGEIIFCVASFFSAANTSSIRLAESIDKSLALMKDILQ